jgi:phage/plasmid-associated DNA primase
MFSLIAPSYWAADIPVIPLRPRQKVPAPNSWQTFATMLPDEETQVEWLSRYADGNIGLALGPQSGMLALDIDTDDPTLIAVIRSVAPPPTWIRKGKKGAVWMYRWNGEKTTRIKDESGATIVEILSASTQVVLPPSIHPDTQLPYTANMELLDAAPLLTQLPQDFEANLRQALIAAGVKLQSRGSVKITSWQPAGGRDSAMMGVAGLLAREVTKGDRTLKEALAEAEQWVIGYTENVVGDPIDPAKASAKVMEFLRRDVLEQGRALKPGWDFGLSDQEIVEARTYFGDDVDEWSYEDFIANLTAQFNDIPRESQGARADLVETALVKLSKSQHIPEMKRDMLLSFINAANPRLVTMAALRKRLRELGGPVVAGEDHTSIANLMITELERYGEIRWDGTSFFQWAGSHWKKKDQAEMSKILANEFGHLPAARRSSDHRGILEVMRNLVPHGLGSEDTPGIAFANGYLTTDMELRPHDPKYGNRYCADYRYAPQEGAPLRLMGLLDASWGHRPDYGDQVQALREAIAAMLFGISHRYARAICLYGVNQSGKSTLKDIIEGLVPSDVVCKIPPHDWADKFLPTGMLGKLLNFCGELSETEMVAGDRFKSIVEGEEVNGQLKGGQIFKFKPVCAHFFATNHLPRTRDTSGGFNRRWLILHFDKRVDDKAKIEGLAKSIVAEEAEAIMAWCVPAITDLLRNHDYTIPDGHKRHVVEMATQNNSTKFFLEAGGVVVHPTPAEGSSNCFTSEENLYNAYYAFSRLTAHVSPVALKRFRLAMTELSNEYGFTIVLSKTAAGVSAAYHGLTLVGAKKGTG